MSAVPARPTQAAASAEGPSQRLRRRWLGPALVVLSALAIALGASVGSTGLDALWRAAQDPVAWQIVMDIRLPRTLGATDRHIILNCILPALVAPILVVATVQFGLVIVAEASLSFLGLGLPVGIPTWGGTISAGRNYLPDAWWISTMPGIALSILVISVGILGDTLRDRLDPNLVTR